MRTEDDAQAFSLASLAEVRYTEIKRKGAASRPIPSAKRGVLDSMCTLSRYDSDLYYGYILRGDLRGAMAYIRQFPEWRERYRRYLEIFQCEQYLRFDVDDATNDLLTLYQRYYRDVFYLGIDRDEAANRLRMSLTRHLDLPDEDTALSDIEQRVLPPLFERKGLHFMGGKTGGYYGPYVWRSTETATYAVELPDGVQATHINFTDGWYTRSWMDVLSFGDFGTGGWTNGDGIIHCVKSAYDVTSEDFQVSLLKHEAQHARDLEAHPKMPPEDLEFRAKLVELIYSKERHLLPVFAAEAAADGADDPHVLAARRIMAGFTALTGKSADACRALSIEDVRRCAKQLWEIEANKSAAGD